jgi:hypothetical protein
MVLAYTEDLSNPDQSISRRNFELNLISDGLELELEDKAVSFDSLFNIKYKTSIFVFHTRTLQAGMFTF